MAHNFEISAGELLDQLRKYPGSYEISFGSSTWSARPLVFYRFKSRGDEHLQIELNELMEFGSGPEYIGRQTVSDFIEELKDVPRHHKIFFGSTLDASPLSLNSITPTITFNFDQPNRAKYFVEVDKPMGDGPIGTVNIIPIDDTD